MPAPVTTTKILNQTDRDATILLTCLASDGTQETSALKVDASTLSGAVVGVPNIVDIEDISWNISPGVAVRLIWDLTSDETAIILCGTGTLKVKGNEKFTIPNPQTGGPTGVTGDILLSTTGLASGSSYYIFLHLLKGSGFTSTARA